MLAMIIDLQNLCSTGYFRRRGACANSWICSAWPNQGLLEPKLLLHHIKDSLPLNVLLVVTKKLPNFNLIVAVDNVETKINFEFSYF